MTFAQYLYNLVGIIGNYAVKEHYTDNGSDVEQLEEIKKACKGLIKYSRDYEVVYKYAEEVQKYIMNKSRRSMRKKKYD